MKTEDIFSVTSCNLSFFKKITTIDFGKEHYILDLLAELKRGKLNERCQALKLDFCPKT